MTPDATQARLALRRAAGRTSAEVVLTLSDAARFWSKVDRAGGSDACWLWTATRDKHGYGRLSHRSGVPGKKRTLKAHRIAWVLTNGAIPFDLGVLHRCDQPACVNPGHLFLGTQLDNVRDMLRKERGATGERHPSRLRPDRLPRGDESFPRRHPERLARGRQLPQAKLDESAVAAIRARYARGGVRGQVLADEFGVSRRTISHVVTGSTWAHVKVTT